MTAMRRFHLGFAVLALLATVASPRVAQAACTSPAGEESQTRYDFTSHVMQYCDGTNWLSMGGGSSSGTAGYIQFANGSGGFASDAGLVWDNTNKRLGIGTATPGTHIHEISSAVTNLTLQETGASNAAQIMLRNTAQTWDIGSDSSPDGFYIQLEGGNQDFLFIKPTGEIGIGTKTPATKLDVAGNNRTSGYVYVGSNSVPNNTTAGDLTATRLSVGNLALGGSYGLVASISGTNTITTANDTTPLVGVSQILAPASASSASPRSFAYSNVFNSANNFTGSPTAAWFENRITTAGTISSVYGQLTTGLLLPATATAMGTVSWAIGGYFVPVSSFGSNGLTSTVTNAVGVRITDSGAATLTITNQAGLNVAPQTAATNNTAILFGTTTVPAGNFGLYQGDTYNNYLAGNVGIGTASPAAKLEVNGGIKIGNNAGSCTGTNNGELRYVSGASPPYSYCNGSAWVPFESGWVVPYTQFTAAQIVPGLYHTCALKSGDALWCWGYNNYGQVGDGTTTGRGAPTTAAGSFTGPWSSISVGAYNTCGIKSADSSAWCWGYNGNGQLGDGTTINRTSSPVQISGTWDQLASGGSTSSNVTYQSGYYTCGVKSDNTGWCWGANAKGTLGDGTTTDRISPVQVSGNWKGIWMAPYESAHTCGIQTDDSLWCWGVNADGQLGDGTTTDRASPVQVTGSWKKVVFAQRSTCAIKTDNTLWCWGYNGYGALGDNTTTNRTSPVQVAGGGTWTDVAIEAYSSSPTVFGIKSNGTAWSWGYNGYGDTKTGTSISTTTLKVPTALASSSAVSGTQWTDFEGGYLTMCGIRDDSTIYCWGAYNYYNRFGDPNLTTYFNPVGG